MFGDKIKEMRLKLNITQEKLGKLIGVGKTTISQYESESRTPDISTFVKLAEIFNCSLDYLVGRENFANDNKIAAHNKGGELEDPDLEIKIQRAVQRALKEEREKKEK